METYNNSFESLIGVFSSLTLEKVPVVDMNMELLGVAGTPAEEEQELLLFKVGLHI